MTVDSSAAPQEALLTIAINGVSDPAPVSVLKDESGRVFVSAERLDALRLSAAALPTITHQGRRYYLLNAVPGASVHVDEAKQELQLTLAASSLAPTRISYAQVDMPDHVVDGTGAFVNYEVSAESSGGEMRTAGLAEAVIFTPHGFGVARFVGRAGGPNDGLIRLDSSWTVDDPERMRSLRIGDSISSGGPAGGPVRFAGIQLARNFSVQPGFIIFPVPSLDGAAELPSVIDVYVNDVLAGSSDVPPGPFDITNIPVVTGTGEVQLVVRDMLGRQRLLTQPYYASSSLLRRGLDDYSYEIGFLRRSYGTQSNDYGSLMVSASHRRGFSDHFTGEAQIQATRQVQSAGVGAVVALPRIGEIHGSIATSRSGHGQGFSLGGSFERRSRGGLSFGLRSELTSSDYTTVGAAPDRRPPASLIHAFAGYPLGSGSLGLSYLRRDGRGEPDAEIASVSWTTRLGRLGSLSLAARTNLSGPKNTAAELWLVVPLGFATSASAGARLDNGKIGLETNVQKSVPLGTGFGYRFHSSTGGHDRVDGRVTWRTDFADYDAQLTWLDGKTGMRVSTAGAIGLVGGNAFASRTLNQSFARVEVSDYPHVRVYADNQLIGRTGSDGSIIVPNLRPYQRNRLRIEATDLPLDAEVAGDEQIVRPYDRTGVIVDFGVRPSRAAFVKVVLEDGAALPGGSSVRIEGRTEEFVSAPGGGVYLTGLEGRSVAIAEWSGGRCRFTVDPQPAASAAPASEVRCGDLQ